MRASERLLPSMVREHLATAVLGRRIYYYPEIGSTNDVALDLARNGEAEGTIVLTDHQHSGRGRHQRAWSSQTGRDLLFSAILRPGGDPKSVLPVTLAISLAVSIALSRVTGAEVGVKWPNDLLADSGKVGGILAVASHRQRKSEFVIVGIGINVNSREGDLPRGLATPPVSCRMLCGEDLDRAAVLGEILGMIEAYYQRFRADGFASLVAAYEARLVHRGLSIRFEHRGKVTTADVVGVGPDGALHVSLQDGGERVALYNEGIEVVS